MSDNSMLGSTIKLNYNILIHSIYIRRTSYDNGLIIFTFSYFR